MEYLKDIISIINKNKTKHLEVIGNERSKDKKLYRLYEGILHGDFNSDVQACRKIYGTNDLNKGYRNLKSRIEKRAINTLFLIDLNSASYSDYEKAYYNCYKNLAATKLLSGKGARKSSIILSEKTLKKSLKYQFHDISIPLLTQLRGYYGTLAGDKKKLRKYNTILHSLIKDRNYTEKARGMYDMLASNLVFTKIINPAHLKLAKDYATEIEKYLTKTSYPTFHLFAHTVIILSHQMENDHQKTIHACDNAIQYFEKIPNSSNSQKFTFLFKKLSSLIQLKDYNNANLNALECLKLVPEGSLNWFFTSQVYIVLLFHSNKVQEAFNFYLQVRTIRNEKKSRLETGKEFWNLIEAFIDYFIRVDKIKIQSNKRKPRFDFKKFITSVPAFSKDKKGMNIMILVLQILFLYHEKNEDEIFERMEKLRNYASRYLRKGDDFRSNCFIKMFLKIPESNSNRIALERNTKDLYKRLKSQPLANADKAFETEIVPFEMLWEMVLESLDRKSPRKRNRRK